MENGMNRPLRLAVVGCGRASERLHMPAQAASPDFSTTILVDRERRHATALADRFDVPEVSTDFHDVVGAADAAIVAVPNHLHGAIGQYLLEHGVHVLVEKPMALTVRECDGMIAAAESSGATLFVGLIRRSYPTFRFVKGLLDRGILGRVRDFDFQEGAVYGWRSASSGNLRKESGGGVLTDIGSHLLDTLTWWLGDARVLEYRDDARGGVEAECRIHLALPDGATGVVRLSRLRPLRNTYRIQTEYAEVEVDAGVGGNIRLSMSEGAPALDGRVSGPQGNPGLSELFNEQLADFAHSIRTGRTPATSGREGRRAIALIEACRKTRENLPEPWAADEAEGLHVV